MTWPSDGLLPNAVQVENGRRGGGSYKAGSWKLVIHEIQGSANPAVIKNHAYPPHLWYDPATRALYQTVPLTRHAFALERRGGDPETNAARALQVEVAGYSSASADEPQQWLDDLAGDVVIPCCQFVASQGGQIILSRFSTSFVYSGAAYYTSPNRMPWAEWADFPGLTGHAWVPGNSHWDPGAMDLARVATHAAIRVGEQLAAAIEVKGPEVAEAYFRKRPVPFDDPGTWGSADDVYDHYLLPANARIVVAAAHPDLPAFTSVLFGPGFSRDAINDVVREVRWGVPAVYTTRQQGQHSIVVPGGSQVDVRAIY